MKTNYQVIEDNGGGLHLFIFDENDSVIRGFSNFEYLSHEDFILNLDALKGGDDGSDWEGQHDNPQAEYDNITSSEFGWVLVANESRMWPERMGRAAQMAFGIEDE